MQKMQGQPRIKYMNGNLKFHNVAFPLFQRHAPSDALNIINFCLIYYTHRRNHSPCHR